jgi:TRAP-type uncharacterized transport system substrate-binding protein
MDMLVNSVLKSAGFTREQFDETVENVKEQVQSFTVRANNIDARVAIVENQVSEILRIVTEINSKLTIPKFEIPEQKVFPLTLEGVSK